MNCTPEQWVSWKNCDGRMNIAKMSSIVRTDLGVTKGRW